MVENCVPIQWSAWRPINLLIVTHSNGAYCLRTETNSHRFYSALSNNHKFADIFRLLKISLFFRFPSNDSYGYDGSCGCVPCYRLLLCRSIHQKHLKKYQFLHMSHLLWTHPSRCYSPPKWLQKFIFVAFGRYGQNTKVDLGSSFNTNFGISFVENTAQRCTIPARSLVSIWCEHADISVDIGDFTNFPIAGNCFTILLFDSTKGTASTHYDPIFARIFEILHAKESHQSDFQVSFFSSPFNKFPSFNFLKFISIGVRVNRSTMWHCFSYSLCRCMDCWVCNFSGS